jgi:mono/diheme cytochrome c family protein
MLRLAFLVHLAAGQLPPGWRAAGTTLLPTCKEENSMKSKFMVVLLVLAILAIPVASWAADEGADLFSAKCAACHGKAGDAESAMAKKMNIKPLSSAEVQKKSDADLTNIISKGKEKMPSYEGKLSPDQIKSLVAYIRTLKK